MSSICISSCVNDVIPSRVRATYVNLHKWPESDAEFVRSLSFRSTSSGYGHPRVVDSISCRQMYLRSYTFTRKKERTINCIGKVKEKVKKKKENGYWNDDNDNHFRVRKSFVMRRVKDMPCADALKCFFRKLLFCSASLQEA